MKYFFYVMGGGSHYKRLRHSVVALVVLLISGLSVTASTIPDSLKFRILFHVDSTTVRPDLFDNEAVLSDFFQTYNSLCQDESVSISGLTICSSASVEGYFDKNKLLAQRRSLSVYKYLRRTYSIPDSTIGKIFVIPAEDAVEAILSSFPETLPGIDLPSIRKIIKTVEGPNLKRSFVKIDGCLEGKNWKWFKKNVLEPARFAEISLFYNKIVSAPDTATVEPAVPAVPAVPAETKPAAEDSTVAAVSAAPAVRKPQQMPESESQAFESESQACENELRLGTNLLYDIASVANLSFEYGFCRHLAVNILATFSPWDIKRPNVKIRTLIFQPEARWYFADHFKGHYVGLEGHFGWYNVALGGKTRYQDRDGKTPLWGAGISYGYVLPVSEHFGFDFGISAGYANLNYDCFYNIENGARFTTKARGWWGPTRAGVSIYYQF